MLTLVLIITSALSYMTAAAAPKRELDFAQMEKADTFSVTVKKLTVEWPQERSGDEPFYLIACGDHPLPSDATPSHKEAREVAKYCGDHPLEWSTCNHVGGYCDEINFKGKCTTRGACKGNMKDGESCNFDRTHHCPLNIDGEPNTKFTLQFWEYDDGLFDGKQHHDVATPLAAIVVDVCDPKSCKEVEIGGGILSFDCDDVDMSQPFTMTLGPVRCNGACDPQRYTATLQVTGCPPPPPPPPLAPLPGCVCKDIPNGCVCSSTWPISEYAQCRCLCIDGSDVCYSSEETCKSKKDEGVFTYCDPDRQSP